MTFRNLKIDHERDAEVDDWIEEETREQEERFEKIAGEMDDLKPKRLKWYQEFFDRIRTIGYNVDADDKMQIASEDLPLQGDREDQVIWKYGVNSDSRKDS